MGETKVDETKPIETKPRKVVGRGVAIALGIVCVLLIASLGGAMAYYTMTINDKNNTIDSINAQLAAITGNSTNTNATEIIDQLNANITNLMNQVTELQTELSGNETSLSQTQVLLSKTQAWLSGNITAYNAYVADHHHTDEEYANYYNIANLANSTIWVNDQTISQPQGSFTTWTESANYAGYVSIYVQSSSVAGTHCLVIYSSHGVSFNQQIVVSAGDSAVFPILPSSSISVEVGNGNSILQGGATETVTITYYY